MSRYYVLRVRGGTELAVTARLTSRGVNAMVPIVESTSAGDRALLTQYAFANGDLAMAEGTQGVIGTLRKPSGEAASVGIDELARMVPLKPATPPRLAPGDLVTVTDGPYKGRAATVVAVKAPGEAVKVPGREDASPRASAPKARISVRCFGRAVLCWIELAKLTKA